MTAIRPLIRSFPNVTIKRIPTVLVVCCERAKDVTLCGSTCQEILTQIALLERGKRMAPKLDCFWERRYGYH